MIQAQDIHKSYGSLSILKGLDLEVKTSEILAITGASGAGKTTLLQILGTLDKADQGNLVVNGVDVMRLKERALASFRNQNIGFVFQFHHLLPEFNCLENVCMPAFIAKQHSLSQIQKRAKALLVHLGMEHRISHRPSELSGGEQQRVAIARALINKPKVIFADEPTGNLDQANTQELHQLFFQLREEWGHTFVIVTHDQALAQVCDRQVHLQNGKIYDDNKQKTNAFMA